MVEILKSPRGPIPVPEEQIENVCLLEKHVGECFYGTDFEVGDAVFCARGAFDRFTGSD